MPQGYPGISGGHSGTLKCAPDALPGRPDGRDFPQGKTGEKFIALEGGELFRQIGRKKLYRAPVPGGDALLRPLLHRAIAPAGYSAVSNSRCNIKGFGRRVRIPGQIDYLRRRLWPPGRRPTPADQQHLADAGIFGEVNSLRVMRGYDGLDMVTVGQVLAYLQSREVGCAHCRQNHSDGPGIRFGQEVGQIQESPAIVG